MELLVLEIWRLNIESKDSDSDDDVSAQSGSDSVILETVEKADFVESLSPLMVMVLLGNAQKKNTSHDQNYALVLHFLL